MKICSCLRLHPTNGQISEWRNSAKLCRSCYLIDSSPCTPHEMIELHVPEDMLANLVLNTAKLRFCAEYASAHALYAISCFAMHITHLKQILLDSAFRNLLLVLRQCKMDSALIINLCDLWVSCLLPAGSAAVLFIEVFGWNQSLCDTNLCCFSVSHRSNTERLHSPCGMTDMMLWMC